MQAVGLQTYIWNNNIRSAVLLIGFPVLLLGMIFALVLGMFLGGVLAPDDSGAFMDALGIMLGAAPAAIVVALVWFAIAYFFNQVIVDLATGSKTVTREQEPDLFNTLENLCISRGMKMPTVKVMETDGMNAFASGLHEGRFSVSVTRGLLQAMNHDELEAVLAHELTHIINRDVRTMVVASIFAGIITLICQVIFRVIIWGGVGGKGRRGGGGVFILVAAAVGAVGYVLSIVIRMAISRSREFVADAGSVELTHNPDAMISALQKVSGHAHLHAPESMRAMFLEDDDDGIFGLFATHPPVDKRIAALVAYGGGRVAEVAPAPAADPAPVAAPAAQAPDATHTGPGPWGTRSTPPGGSGPWS